MPDLRQAVSAAYLADEDAILESLIAKARLSKAEQAAANALATELVTRLRWGRENRQGVDAFTQEYTLSSDEGVMLMCLAEALLRVPDAESRTGSSATRSPGRIGPATSAIRSRCWSTRRPGP
jgi:RHH-type proline utilization regulon transcriptional repressor/proline dehydrogenase/delta 1-pyrroline-5-carboxylate dehydrogenase